MNNYIVIWVRKGFNNEFVDIISDVKNEQEAVNKVLKIHILSRVLCVGIMSDMKTWKNLSFEDEIEKESIECENSSFKYDDCNNISKFESGKEWLYNNRCRTCQHKLKCPLL